MESPDEEFLYELDKTDMDLAWRLVLARITEGEDDDPTRLRAEFCKAVAEIGALKKSLAGEEGVCGTDRIGMPIRIRSNPESAKVFVNADLQRVKALAEVDRRRALGSAKSEALWRRRAQEKAGRTD